MTFEELAPLVDPEVRVVFTKKKVPFGRQKIRFRFVSPYNGKVLASSNDAYVNRADAEEAVETIVGSANRPKGAVQYRYVGF